MSGPLPTGTVGYNMAGSNSDRVTVVTQVYPQQNVPAAPAFCTVPHISSLLGQFLKGDPKAMGTVQIMIGVTIILFGSVMAVHPDTIGVLSGIVFWAALFYISSGALSVAANNKLNKCLVKGALVMNILSTICAGISIIIYSLDLVIEIRYYFCYGFGFDYTDSYSSNICDELWHAHKTRSNGITGVFLLFSILEFIITILLSAFACKAVCDSAPEQVIYISHPANQTNNVTPGNCIPAPSSNEMPIPQILGQSVMVNKDTERPPAYTAVVP